MSKKFRDWNLDQPCLFPRSVKDFVKSDHLSNFVKDLVLEELDLSEILSKYKELRGYPPYDPRMMTCVLLYSYMLGVYSSRKMSKCCEERVDFMSLSGMSTPDFRTLSDFRKTHLAELGGLFVQVLKLCQEAKIVKLGHISLDGTKIKANASKKKNIKYEKLKVAETALQMEVEEWLKKAEAVDVKEDGEYGIDKRGDELPSWVSDKTQRLSRLKEARESLEKKDKEKRDARSKATEDGTKSKSTRSNETAPSDSKRHNFTDTDSELMRSPEGFIQGYNAQVSVDSESHVIVSCHVTTDGNDIDQLKPTITQIEENLGVLPKELSADYGYLSNENLKILEDNNIRGYIAVGADPAQYKKNLEKDSRVYKMMQRIKKGGLRTRYRLRKQTVELVFADIKEIRNFRRFYLRSKEKVSHEWSLICTAYNLRKLRLCRA